MRPDRATRADVVLRVALVWTWGVTGGCFWSLAAKREALLPGVPRVVWVLPGWLWTHAPALAIGLLAAGTFVAVAWPARLPRARPAVIAALLVVIGVALVWGGALLAQMPGTS